MDIGLWSDTTQYCVVWSAAVPCHDSSHSFRTQKFNWIHNCGWSAVQRKESKARERGY